jgi:hypothetical protein
VGVEIAIGALADAVRDMNVERKRLRLSIHVGFILVGAMGGSNRFEMDTARSLISS